MKKVRPLLLLGLVLGGVYLRPNTGKLSLINWCRVEQKKFYPGVYSFLYRLPT